MKIQQISANNIASTGLRAKQRGMQPIVQRVNNTNAVNPKISFWAKIKAIFTSLKHIPPKSTLNPDKVQSDKIFELESFIDNWLLVEEFFNTHPDIDINSQDSNGDTLLIRAVKQNDEKMLFALHRINNIGKYGKVDWNVVDSNGNNAYMIDINNLKHFNSFSPLSICISDHVDANYINPKTKLTPLQLAIKKENSPYISLLSMKSDINNTHPDTPPASFMLLNSGNIKSLAKEDFFARKPDLDATYKGKTIFEYINLKKIGNISSDLLKVFEKHLALKNLTKMREYYKQEGFLDITQLLDYIKQPYFSEICNQSISDIGENIGHFITEIYPKNFDEIKQLSEVIDIIDRSGYNFESCDDLGRTAIDKAIEGQNLSVLKFLLTKIPSKGLYQTVFQHEFYKNIEEMLIKHDISDQTILKIFKEKNK